MAPAKADLKALEYRNRAQDALDAASVCTLDRAREQHHSAALRWIELAEAEESRARATRARLAPADTDCAG